MAGELTLKQAAARSGLSERELRRAIAAGKLPIAGRKGRARLVGLEDLGAFTHERLAAPPRRGRPTQTTSLSAAAEQYRDDMHAFFAADNRRRLERLVRAYHGAAQEFAQLEEDLRVRRVAVRMLPKTGELEAAIRGARTVWMSEESDRDMSFVRIRRLAGWTWPAIAKAMGRTERWAQMLDRRWRETFGVVIDDARKEEEQQ